GPIGALLAAALITRSTLGAGLVYFALSAPLLAPDLAAALSSHDLAERAAAALLADPRSPTAALLAVAGASYSPSQRGALLERAAQKARAEGRTSLEIDALFALAASPEARTAARLGPLERLWRATRAPRASGRV